MNPEEYVRLTVDQVAFLCFQHVHCAVLTLRRCIMSVNRRDDDGTRTTLGTCQRPATMVRPVDLGRSVYQCDACAAVFGQKPPFTELPQAAVVRRYNTVTASPEAFKGASPHDAVALARALVAALPPCPNATVDQALVDAVAKQPFMPMDERVAMAASAVAIDDPLASCARCRGLAWPPVATVLMDLDVFLVQVDADPRFAEAR